MLSPACTPNLLLFFRTEFHEFSQSTSKIHIYLIDKMYHTIGQSRFLNLVFNSARLKGKQYCRPQLTRSLNDSSAYGGDGKTTVRVLNNEETHLNLVNTYSDKGFRLANNIFIVGSILLFPTHVYSWNVRRGIDITPESLFIFDLIVPKTKIIIIGYGEEGEPYDSSIPLILKKKGISCEMLTTPNAVTTYNFLVHDAVHVAGAFVPVKNQVIMRQKDHEAFNDIIHNDKDMMKRRAEDSELHRPSYDEIDKIKKQLARDEGKQKFDE